MWSSVIDLIILSPKDGSRKERKMNWNDMSKIRLNDPEEKQIETNIECPDCGRNIYLDTSIVLTSYPAKYYYWCVCGWVGYSHVKWSKELEKKKKND